MYGLRAFSRRLTLRKYLVNIFIGFHRETFSQPLSLFRLTVCDVSLVQIVLVTLCPSCLRLGMDGY